MPSSVCISVSSRYPSLIILFTRSTTLRSVKRNAGLVACTASSCAWSARISSMAPEGGRVSIGCVEPAGESTLGRATAARPAVAIPRQTNSGASSGADGSKITAAIPIRAAALR